MKNRDELIPTEPLLEALFGMPAARAWGQNIAHDMADFINGRISWRQVDPGVLIWGPPGTGKNLFAKGVAASCKVPLVCTSYARWQRSRSGHLGDVLAAMHEDFEFARRCAPCILFIDEFEAVGSRSLGGHNQNWYTAIITALNEEFNGLAAQEGVVVIAAANYPDRIDAALLRAGRLDTKIAITTPSIEDLKGILRFHLDPDLANADLGRVAVAAAGMTGAEIEKAVRMARRRARRFRRPLLLNDLFAVLGQDLEELGPKLVERMAIHEAGHAIAAIALNVSRNVSVSLLQSGKGGAVTNFELPVEAVTREVVEKRMAAALAGRAAEEVLLGDVTGGAGGDEQSDLGVARGLAISAVVKWGLSPSPRTRWGVASHRALVNEVNGMLDAAYARALALIGQRRRQVRSLATALLKRRALEHRDIVKLLRRVGARSRKSRRLMRPGEEA